MAVISADWLAVLQQESVARLATAHDNQPHLVPIVFVVYENKIYTPLDGKQKSGKTLKRIKNIKENPKVSLLIDSYDSDWTKLCWLRIDGYATKQALHKPVEELLRRKYRNYQTVRVGTQCICIQPQKIASWRMVPGPDITET